MNASLIAPTSAPAQLAASKAVIVQSDAATKTDFHQLLRQATNVGSAGRPLSGAVSKTPATSPQWSTSTLQPATEQPATEPSPETPASPINVLEPDTDVLHDPEKASSPQQAVVNTPTYTADTKDIVHAAETSATGVASAPAQATVPTSSASGKSTRGGSGKMSRPASVAQAEKKASGSQTQPEGVNVLTQYAPQPVVIAQWSPAPTLPVDVSSSSSGTAQDASLQTAPKVQQGSSYSYISTPLPQESSTSSWTNSIVPRNGTLVTDNAAATHAVNTRVRNDTSAPTNSASTAAEPQSPFVGKAKDDTSNLTDTPISGSPALPVDLAQVAGQTPSAASAKNSAILSPGATDTATPDASVSKSPAQPVDLRNAAAPTQSTGSTKDAAIPTVNTAGAEKQATNTSPDLPPEIAQVVTSAGTTAAVAQVSTKGAAKAATQSVPIPANKHSSRATQTQNNAATDRTSHAAVSDVPAEKSLETSSVKTKTNIQEISATPEATTGAVISVSERDSASSNAARVGRKKVSATAKSTPDAMEATPISAVTGQGGSTSPTPVASTHLAPNAQVASTSPTTTPAPDTTLSNSAILQGVQGVPYAPAHAAQSSASPAFTAHDSTQAAPVAEPPHSLDTAQLRVHGDVSELKISVQLPELGKVEVRATNTHDVTTAHITAAHDALPVFAAGRSGLEEVLKLHDVTLGSFSSPAQGQSNGQSSQQSFHSPAQPQSSATLGTTIDPATEEVDRPGYLPDHTSISVRA